MHGLTDWQMFALWLLLTPEGMLTLLATILVIIGSAIYGFVRLIRRIHSNRQKGNT